MNESTRMSRIIGKQGDESNDLENQKVKDRDMGGWMTIKYFQIIYGISPRGWELMFNFSQIHISTIYIQIYIMCLGYIIQYSNYSINVPTALQGIKSKIYPSNQVNPEKRKIQGKIRQKKDKIHKIQNSDTVMF